MSEEFKKQIEKSQEEQLEQNTEIPENKDSIVLKVNPENEKEIKAAEQKEIKELKKQIEEQFSDKGYFNAKKSAGIEQKNFKGEVSKQKDSNYFKETGIRLGGSLSWIISSFRNKVDKFDIKHSGGENIREIEGKSYLLAANHIKPKNIIMQALGVSPDSFVLEKIGSQEGKKKPKIITNITGKVSKIPILGFVDKFWSPFREGIMEGMGLIPIKTKKEGKKGGLNRNFIEKIKKSTETGEPIIIFPQGHWDRKFNPDLPFDTGSATIAKNYGLPIVPAYIEGADSWKKGQKVYVNIGQSIDPEGKTKEEITEEIKNSIITLSKEKDSLPND